MKHFRLSLIILANLAALLVSRWVLADPSTQPTTSPAIDVLVLPFTPLGEQNSQAFISRAVEQNLLADLGRAHFHPAALNDSAGDPQSAGRSNGARFVISGSYQTIDETLRFDGQILDANSGAVVGGLSATGAPRDLFALEDSLSQQALRQLFRLMNPAATPKTPVNPLAQAGIVQNPVAGMRTYEGSSLQQYVDANRTPSTDFAAQARRSSDQQKFNYNSGGSSWPYSDGAAYPFSGSNYFSGYGGFAYGYATPFVYMTGRVGRPVYFSRDYSLQP